MPTLESTYLDYDLTFLKAIASQAGVELNASNARAAAMQLAQALQNHETVELLMFRILPSALNENISPEQLALKDQTDAALKHLLASQGRAPLAQFSRRYGEARPLGPVALAREKPWENPQNATESLFFNGLIGRAFMESDSGPQEFFFIPSDLMPNLPNLPAAPPPTPAEAVSVSVDADSASQIANVGLADDAVTVLAALQLKPGKIPDPEKISRYLRHPALHLLMSLLTDLKMISDDLRVDPEQAKPFMQADRGAQLSTLANAWRDSNRWNDLLHVPSLKHEPGSWRNDPLAARALILKLCADLPANEWRSLDSFITFVREHHADFQRPAGDYDSWYIRDAKTGEYLRGFEHWDDVEGALLRYIITSPMHWLGLVHLKPDAFRLTTLFTAFIANTVWPLVENKGAKIVVRSDGTFTVPFDMNRYERFQAARIGEWLPLSGNHYSYRLTGNSLNTAGLQGITAKHIISFLRRHCARIPGNVVEAIDRWGRSGVEARASQIMILRLENPGLLDFVRRNPKTAPYLGEVIGSSAIEVKDWKRLQEGMMEAGLVVEVKD